MEALAADALDPFGTDATEATRKLSLLKSGPEKDIYNRYGKRWHRPTPYLLNTDAMCSPSDS